MGRPDLADTIARLQAYQEAGADVLFAPGLTSEEDIRTLVRSVDRPVNVIAVPGMPFSQAQLGEMGVKRISVGSALDPRRLRRACCEAAREMREQGTFGFAKTAPPTARFNAVFTR